MDANGRRRALSHTAAQTAPSASGPSTHLYRQGNAMAAFQDQGEQRAKTTEEQVVRSCRHHGTTSQMGICSQH